MKKIALILSVIVMVIGSVMPAFAQESINVRGTVTIAEGKDKDGKDVEIVIDDLTDEDQALVDDILRPYNLRRLLGDDYSDKLQVVDAVNVYAVDKNGNRITGSRATDIYPVSITFNVPGATANGNVKVLYYKDGKWYVADDITVGENTVAGAFDQASPYIFLVEGTPTTVSPKTGYNNVVLYMAILAVASFTTIVVLHKKKIA